MIDRFKTAAAVVGGIMTIAAAWALFELPVPAMRGWVIERLRPHQDDSMTLLLVRRELLYTQLFQWEHNNPEPRSADVRWNIERIRLEIADVDRQIAARRR